MKSVATASTTELEWIDDATRAATLLHPLRLSIVRHAAVPMSASGIADALGLPRQRVNYHVRELAKAGFLRRAGTRRKRNLIERLYVASARGYLLGAAVLGPAGPAATALESAGATHLLAVAARTQSEVARAAAAASSEGLSLPALSLAADIRFTSAKQRAAFVTALSTAIASVVRDHTSPERLPDGEPGPGRPHRLVVFCHPAPAPAVDAPAPAMTRAVGARRRPARARAPAARPGRDRA